MASNASSAVCAAGIGQGLRKLADFGIARIESAGLTQATSV